MSPSLTITKIWEDDDMIEVTLSVCDGKSTFSAEIYVGFGDLKEAVASMEHFKSHVHGGIYDLSWGAFGPEFASGAARIRFHFHHQARLCISSSMESGYFEFGLKKVAHSAEQFFYSEPALLDNFVTELSSLAEGNLDTAMLIGKN